MDANISKIESQNESPKLRDKKEQAELDVQIADLDEEFSVASIMSKTKSNFYQNAKFGSTNTLNTINASFTGLNIEENTEKRAIYAFEKPKTN